MMSPDLAVLRSRWIGLCHQIRRDGEVHWIGIQSAYTAPGRAYHNLTHIADCFEQLDSAPITPGKPLAVEFALWFHDLVHESNANDNEERSADAALKFLADTTIAEPVADIILATKHLAAPELLDSRLVCDIDLSILGRNSDEYRDYAKVIRQEYQKVSDSDYADARGNVLRNLLDRDHIYSLKYFQENYERQARMNLHSELEQLDRMSQPIYTIRSATNEDGPEITELVFRVLREYGLPPNPQTTDADLSDIQSFYHERNGFFDVLLNAQGSIIGTVALLPLENSRCELRKMYLDTNERGKGHGKRLLDHALKRAQEMGFTTMVLETATPLKEAIALYKSYGFRPYRPDHMADRCDQAFIRNCHER